MITFLY